MCPFCLAHAAWVLGSVVAGTASASGICTLVVRRVRPKQSAAQLARRFKKGDSQ